MKSARPPLLTILCVAGLIGCFLRMILVLSPPVQALGRWYAVYLSLGTVYSILCFYYLWMMRKWAVWAFGACVLADQLVYLGMGIWNGKALILGAAILATSFYYYRRMK